MSNRYKQDVMFVETTLEENTRPTSGRLGEGYWHVCRHPSSVIWKHVVHLKNGHKYEMKTHGFRERMPPPSLVLDWWEDRDEWHQVEWILNVVERIYRSTLPKEFKHWDFEERLRCWWACKQAEENAYYGRHARAMVFLRWAYGQYKGETDARLEIRILRAARFIWNQGSPCFLSYLLGRKVTHANYQEGPPLMMETLRLMCFQAFTKEEFMVIDNCLLQGHDPEEILFPRPKRFRHPTPAAMFAAAAKLKSL